jgi:plasmid stabilization system protein ParE
MNFRVTEAARDEAAGIARWYNDRPGRYGAAFLDEFEGALAAIAAHPRHHSLAEDGREGHEDREYFIARFKQRVVFTIDHNGITVLSVIHSSRKPGTWFRRLPPDEPKTE